MTAIAIDTLAITKRLKLGGYSQEQAEVQAEILKEIVDENLVTKADLTSTKTDLERSIKELEYRLTIKLGGMLVIAITAVTALIKLLH